MQLLDAQDFAHVAAVGPARPDRADLVQACIIAFETAMVRPSSTVHHKECH